MVLQQHFSVGCGSEHWHFLLVDEEGFLDLFQSRLVAWHHFDDHLGGNH
jgi:hypothetical protein